jgi:phage terminase small subunit
MVTKKKAAPKKKVVKKKAVKKKVSPSKQPRKLIPTEEKYKAFAYEYITNNFNGKKAAIAAGYSPKSAEQQASRMLRIPKVQGYLSKFSKERNKRQKVDSDWVLQRLVEELNADLADLYYKDGGLKPVHEWPKIWRLGLVAGVEVDQKYVDTGEGKEPDGYVTKLRLSERTKRMEMTGKHIDVLAFLKQVEVSENQDVATRLRNIREIAKGKHGGTS